MKLTDVINIKRKIPMSSGAAVDQGVTGSIPLVYM